MAFEKELLGFYLTSHPMEAYITRLEDLGAIPIVQVTKERIGDRISVAGIIVEVKKIMTKANNHEMAFIRLEDVVGTVEVVIFPKIYAKCVGVLEKDAILLIAGKVDEKDDRLTLLADDVKLIANNKTQ